VISRPRSRSWPARSFAFGSFTGRCLSGRCLSGRCLSGRCLFRLCLFGLCALALTGCPRQVPRDDAGPGRIDAGPLGEVDAGELATNDFEGPLSFNDVALRALDPATLPRGNIQCRQPVLVRVEFVIDGDTLQAAGVNGAFTGLVRFIGVDTPEIARDGMPADCYGPEARAFTRNLEGRLVWLTFDEECFDGFDRVLAYVHVGPDEGGFWQRQLLRRGFATELGIGADRSFEAMFEADQAIAASAGEGLWSACR
jgi:micrococcal nuclease